MEKKTGIISGKDYIVHPIQEQLVVTPVEMQPNVAYTLPQRVIERVRQHMPRKDGKR